MTTATYNVTDFPWVDIKAHVMVAWENYNESLNLQLLRQQILAMQRARNQVISPVNMAKTILEELQCFKPLNSLKHSF
jgi:hypothetical protein